MKRRFVSKGGGWDSFRGLPKSQWSFRTLYHEVVIEGITRKASVFLWDSIIRQTDKALNNGDDVVVGFPRTTIEDIKERVEKILGPSKGWSIIVYTGTTSAEREDTTAIVETYR